MLLTDRWTDRQTDNIRVAITELICTKCIVMFMLVLVTMYKIYKSMEQSIVAQGSQPPVSLLVLPWSPFDRSIIQSNRISLVERRRISYEQREAVNAAI